MRNVCIGEEEQRGEREEKTPKLSLLENDLTGIREIK